MREFLTDLYREHVEEVSFLYEQCRHLRRGGDLPWTCVQGFETRLEAHLDALVIGAALAQEVCDQRASAGDAGELFAAVCVYCRQAAAASLAQVFAGLDALSPEHIRAVGDALQQELPGAWAERCLQAMDHGRPSLAGVLARVVGYRRIPTRGALARLLQYGPEDARTDVCWAAGRLREPECLPALAAVPAQPNAASPDAALRARLRLHDVDLQRSLLTRAASEPVYALMLGLAGGHSAAAGLRSLLRVEQPDVQTVVALGLIGDLAAVRPLLRRMEMPALAEVCAEALFVLTGAPLFEDVFVPDPISEDELFENERSMVRRDGISPRRGDGQPFGDVVRGLSTNATDWQVWLDTHAAQFQSGLRHRLGRPCTPLATLRGLCMETMPRRWRCLFAEELLVRYDLDVPWELDMPVAIQWRVLNAAIPAAEAKTKACVAGRWYFAGRELRQ